MQWGGVAYPPGLSSFLPSVVPSSFQRSGFPVLDPFRVQKNPCNIYRGLSAGVLWRRLYVVIDLLYLLAVTTEVVRFAGFGVAVVVPAFEVYPLAVGLYPVAPDPLCGSYFQGPAVDMFEGVIHWLCLFLGYQLRSRLYLFWRRLWPSIQ